MAENKIVKHFYDRNKIQRGQTPQCFKYYLIMNCHDSAKKLDKYPEVTDDCGLVNIFYPDKEIFCVRGDESNIKITYPQDIFLADKLLQLKTYEVKNTDIDIEYFKDKSMIIFGGFGGIGQEIYKISKNIGINVECFSRTNNVDIKNTTDVANAIEFCVKKYGKIDFIINSAGVLYSKPLKNTTYEEITEQINTNFLGCVNIVKESIRLLSSTHILLFSSSSYTVGRSNYGIYSATKSAIVNFTQAMSEELKDSSIKISCVCPKRTKTQMRLKNFGAEPENTLLDPNNVAQKCMQILSSKNNSCIIKV